LRVAPHAVRELIDAWRAAGRPSQPGIRWPRDRWIDAFPQQCQLLQGLPDAVDRAAIRAAARQAADGPTQAVDAFVAAMVWGYGRVGYGPWRTRRVLHATPDAAASLATAARIVATDGGLAAYEALSGSLRLRYLGPAFGTKFLYFVPHRSDSSALILDRLVARWLNRNIDARINALYWAPATYRYYVALLSEWARQLDVTPDTIEERIFVASATEAGGQWAPS
jgi:hypothetical protein